MCSSHARETVDSGEHAQRERHFGGTGDIRLIHKRKSADAEAQKKLRALLNTNQTSPDLNCYLLQSCLSCP